MNEYDKHYEAQEAQAAMIDSQIEDYLDSMTIDEVQDVITNNAGEIANAYIEIRDCKDKKKIFPDPLLAVLEEEARIAVEDNLGL